MKGSPWDWLETAALRTGRVFLERAPDPVDLPPPATPHARASKAVYLRRDVELARYGYTPSCPGCMAAAFGAQARPHSEACRARVTAAMREAGDTGRLDESAARHRSRQEVLPPAGGSGGSGQPTHSGDLQGSPLQDPGLQLRAMGDLQDLPSEDPGLQLRATGASASHAPRRRQPRITPHRGTWDPASCRGSGPIALAFAVYDGGAQPRGRPETRPSGRGWRGRAPWRHPTERRGRGS